MIKDSTVRVGLFALVATTASCAAVIGLDGDYSEAGSTGGGGAGGAGGAGGSGESSSATTGGGEGGAGGSLGGSGGAGGRGSVDGPPSCAGLPATCGPNSDEDCCAVRAVEGGTFKRDNLLMSNGQTEYPATVSSFVLDRFEFTVGRFRKFVDAYPASKPAVGAGSHPKIADSGWLSIWSANLPATQAELIAAVSSQCPDQARMTWTEAPGAHEQHPMSCLSWFMTFAFCAWDGGRLPTEAEWNYAAAGGAEQREYPWGPGEIDATYAVYDCTGDGSDPSSCLLSDIFPVGSRSPRGDGRWGHADLAGNLWEWVRDNNSFEYPLPCVDCAVIQPTGQRRVRGGSWYTIGANTNSEYWASQDPAGHFIEFGGRCARDLPDP
jgi:formylglycine-generating enzyme